MKLCKLIMSAAMALVSLASWGFDNTVPTPFTVKLDGSGHERVVDSAYDDDGNLYLVGYYQNGSDTYLRTYQASASDETERTQIAVEVLASNRGGKDLFVAKLDWLGNIEWVKTAGGVGDDGANGVAFDRRHNQLFISGYITDSADFHLSQVTATSGSTGLVNANTTNLFVAVMNLENGQWNDIKPLPIDARISLENGTTVAGRQLKNLVITGGKTDPGNGLVIAKDDTDISSALVIYVKGQVNDTESQNADVDPGNGTNWLSNIGLAVTDPGVGIVEEYTAAHLKGESNGVTTTGTGNWSFITKIRYFQNPNPALNQERWNWDWLKQPNQGLEPVAGASDTYNQNCEGVAVGSNLDLGLQNGTDSSNVWNSDVDVNSGSPEYNVNFSDPLPAGATLTSVNVSVEFAIFHGYHLYTQPYSYDVRIGGQVIGDWFFQPQSPIPIDPPQYLPWGTENFNYSLPLSTYNYGGGNTLSLRMLEGVSIYFTKVVLSLSYTQQSGEPCHMDIITDLKVDPALGTTSPVYFSGNWRSGYKVASSTYQSQDGGRNGFVGSLRDNGDWDFFAHAGGYSSVEAIELTDDDNLLVAGYAGLSSDTETNLKLDSFGGGLPKILTPSAGFGATESLFGKVDVSNGDWLWGQLKPELAASYDLAKSLQGDWIAVGTTDSSSSGNAIIAKFDNDSSVNFTGTKSSSQPGTFSYHAIVNNLNTLYVFGGAQQYAASPYQTPLSFNSNAYSDFDTSAADNVTGLGTLIHDLDPATLDFQAEFQFYDRYIVGDLVAPQIGAGNYQDTLSYRRTIPNNLGLQAITSGTTTPLNDPLLAVQANLAVYAGGPINNAVVLWPTSSNAQLAHQPIVGRAIKIRWPTVAEGLQEYIYSTTSDVEVPPVELNHSELDPGAKRFHWLQYGEDLTGTAQPSGLETSAADQLITTEDRTASLVFFDSDDPAQGAPTVISVRSYHWDDPLKHVENISVDIGKTLAIPAETIPGEAGGYVMTALGRYDTGVSSEPLVYERETRIGQIIPVNINGSDDVDGDGNYDDFADDLKVAWYQEGVESSVQDRHWPVLARSYNPQWPTDAGLIVLASDKGSLGLQSGVEQSIEGLTPPFAPVIYYQNDRTQPGFNPNEEQAFVRLENHNDAEVFVVHAIRNDLNHRGIETSDPYAMARYFDDGVNEYRYRVFKVDYASSDYPSFELNATVGSKAYAPSYFRNAITGLTHPANQATQEAFYLDRNQELWSRSAGTDSNPINLDVNFYYELFDPSFWYDPDGDGTANEVAEVPWLAFHDGDSNTPHTLTFQNEWPDEHITVYLGDTLFDEVENKQFLTVLYDENDEIDHDDPTSADRANNATLRLFNYVAEIRAEMGANYTYKVDANDSGPVIKIEHPSFTTVTLPTRQLPSEGVGVYDFPTLPTDLRYRVRFQALDSHPQKGYMYFQGGDVHPETAQESTLDSAVHLVNVMTDFEREILKRFDNSGNDPYGNLTDENVTLWDDVVDALYHQSRNPNSVDTNVANESNIYIGLEQPDSALEVKHQTVQGAVALTAAFAKKPGYVVIGENVDDPNLTGNPVALHVFRVEDQLAAGKINVFRNALNHLDTRLVLRHDLDFGGQGDDLTFEWFWTDAQGPDGGPPSITLQDGRPVGWQTLVSEASGDGVATYYLNSGLQLLSDGYLVCRYKGLITDSDPTGENWSPLAGGSFNVATQTLEPKFVQGWVKRVMSNINEFESRYTDFHANEVNSYTSMIVQAGPEYKSDVALTGEDGALDEVGLIELYQTILNYAVNLSIDAGITEHESVNKQLLFAASRIASLYMLLGNEAFSDAMDPTIGVVTESGNTSYLQPSLYAFQGTLGSLLEEELALLRGVAGSNDLTGNRLLWNLIGGPSEAAYVQVYGIADTDGDGVEDESQELFPQGHGDAWGHYLTTTKLYYSLARHEGYDWQPLTDTTLIAGQSLVVDYKDEQMFAKAAAAKARTGARIVDLTFRNEYTHAPAGQWLGYKDTDNARAWGMDGWARRAGQGAVFDWALANALLPLEDTDSQGIAKIDRQTVTAISEIPQALVDIESVISRADRGSNPFGLNGDAIPFDIDANALQAGESHFEQVYARAKTASNNALEIFNYANELTQQIRVSQLDNAEFQQLEAEKERDFKSRLIELMGYPYTGNVGPGKLYPTGYNGPDLYQYMYIDSDLPGAEPSVLSSINLEVPALGIDGCGGDCNINSFLFDVDIDSATDVTNNYDFIDGDGNLQVSLPVSTNTDYAFIKPNASWGSRPAPGKIQLQLGEMQQIQARIKTTLADQQSLQAKIQAEVDLLESIYNIRAQQINTYDSMKSNFQTLSALLATSRAVSNGLLLAGEDIYRWAGIVQKAAPTAAGFSNDIGTIPRIGISVTYSGLTASLLAASVIADAAEFGFESAVEQAAFNARIDVKKGEFPLDIQKQLTVIEKLINDEIKFRYNLVELRQELANAHGQYESLVAEAFRIMAERLDFRKDVASRTTNERYRDMTYRVFRNDALQKYRASFDLAAKYTYLAAKAFDYETGLLSDDANGIDQSFYEGIIKERALGQYSDSGEPVAGVHGLSTPLAKMSVAFGAAESAFGALDPLGQEFNFSLREEGFRVVDGDSGKDRWHELLQNARVDDLWQVPEFAKYCVPPGVGPSDGPLPGIVLRFGTTIHLDKNLFGWDKGSVDSTYSPSYSATKFYRVGLEFEDYPAGLVNTPYGYLVPVGTDILRSPTDITKLRSYQVFDQSIPVPTDLTTGDTSYQQEGWIPNNDGVLTRWDKRRRHSELPINISSGSGISTSGRLVGRSAWNTEWILIIPGNSLWVDGQTGLDTLIAGDATDPLNEGITDIRLIFDTYSFPAQ